MDSCSHWVCLAQYHISVTMVHSGGLGRNKTNQKKHMYAVIVPETIPLVSTNCSPGASCSNGDAFILNSPPDIFPWFKPGTSRSSVDF